jgi:outer membrane protein TolC
VGVRIPIFNRNQGNIATAEADAERAKREVERVKLVLGERSAGVVQNYTFSQIYIQTNTVESAFSLFSAV